MKKSFSANVLIKHVFHSERIVNIEVEASSREEAILLANAEAKKDLKDLRGVCPEVSSVEYFESYVEDVEVYSEMELEERNYESIRRFFTKEPIMKSEGT